jgi:hypothetical protein
VECISPKRFKRPNWSITVKTAHQISKYK